MDSCFGGESIRVDVSLKESYDCKWNKGSGHVLYLREQKMRSHGRYSDTHIRTPKVPNSADYKANLSLRR